MSPLATSGQRDRGVLGVDGVQDPFVADLGLRHQADFAAKIRRPSTHRWRAVRRPRSTKKIDARPKPLNTI